MELFALRGSGALKDPRGVAQKWAEVGPEWAEVDRKWTEVGPAQKWTEVCYFRSTSGTSLSPADREGERSGPEVGHFTYEICSVLYSHILHITI